MFTQVILVKPELYNRRNFGRYRVNALQFNILYKLSAFQYKNDLNLFKMNRTVKRISAFFDVGAF